MVRTNTLVIPGMGAGVVRVKGTGRALALSVDGNGRYVYLDPFLGAQLAVAEAARNVACTGAEPVGATNCLNFGNPEKPEIMWQFARAVDGLAAACRALDIPITGGNVSLYNETDGRAVLPTPVLGVVGIIEDDSRVVRRTFQREGDLIVLLGTSANELGGSEYLKTIHGLVRGRPPALDLGREAALQRLIVDAIAQGLVRSAHDCAEGGLAITIAESCFDTGLGALADLPAVEVDAADFCDISTLFNESASRVVASAEPQAAERLVQLAEKRSVPARVIGRVGGDRIRIGIDGRGLIDEPVVGAERIWADTIGAYFESQRAIA
jgi:phosphoribosylformylglycinamidine synthase subunit PurL